MPRILKSLLTVAIIMTPAVSVAQANCAARDSVVSKLASGYGEEFAGGGLQNAKAIFEVWFSDDKGTWTILMTRPDGMSCVMASGTNWRDSLPGLVEQPAGVPG